MKKNNLEVRLEKPYPNIRLGSRLFLESKLGSNELYEKTPSDRARLYDEEMNPEFNKLVYFVFRLTMPTALGKYLFENSNSVLIGNDDKEKKNSEADYINSWMGINLTDLIDLIKKLSNSEFTDFKKLLIEEVDFVVKMQTKESNVFSGLLGKYL